MKRISSMTLVVAAMLSPSIPAVAQPGDYPNRPIRAITTTSAGGLSDLFMRALGEELRVRTGQPLIVDNRPGGAMNVGTRACTESPPDGYTICITNADAMAYNQFLFKKMPFDPETQLQPITNAFHLIHMLVVNSKLNVKTVDELIALSKAKPGTFSYHGAGSAAVPLHGDAEQGARRRLGSGAVPRRRRRGQRHPRWLDADCAVRRGQRHRAHPMPAP